MIAMIATCKYKDVNSVETWQSMETAPRDGRWFLVLKSPTLIGVGKPARAIPELCVIRRARTSPESAGYWENTYYNSVADDFVSHGLWADIDALPLREMYVNIERDRILQGGDPMSLPVPYDKKAS